MPAPPRNKLYNKTGKHKTINTSYGPSSSAVVSTPAALGAENSSAAVVASATDTEAERQLELELCWCIQTLAASMESGKLNAKQAQDTEKTIKLLKSTTQPVIKKRQIMRASFGDYRAKMAEEENKLRLKRQQIHFTSANEEPMVKSHFVKKAAFKDLGKEFKFGFPTANALERLDISDETVASSVVSETDGNKAAAVQPSAVNTLSVLPSSNCFRFNFAIETE